MRFFADILKSCAILLLLVLLVLILDDIMRSDFRDKRFKWIWMAVVTFLPIIGIIFYYFLRKKCNVDDQINDK